MIVEELRESTYKEYLDWWQSANRCCKHLCQHGEDECDDRWETHNKQLQNIMAKLGQREYKTSFNKSRKV